ncbi:ABC transporter permease [Chryseolinea soli]|nr:ABC transporter permease [Chryseolinea soli]
MKNNKPQNDGPPRWAVRFFRWYCNDYLSEAALGDFIELYDRRRVSLGKRKADLLFIGNVLAFLQPFALRRKRKSYGLNELAMFENYFKIAWRTMARQKMYSSIMVGGFALGLATCLVIFLYIRHELSFDKSYTQGERIYRVFNDYRGPDGSRWTSMPPMVAQIMKTDYPEVEKAGRLVPQKWQQAGSNLFRREDQAENLYEEGFVYADNELLDILEIPFVSGSRETALAKPNSIVLSKRMADKYFPGEDAVGKTVILNENKTTPYVIGGVMANFPSNTHLHYDFLLTLTGVEFWPGEQTSWCCWNYDTYVRLKPGTDPVALEKKLLTIRDTYMMNYLKETGDPGAAEAKTRYFIGLQPVKNIHLDPEKVSDDMHRGDVRYIWLFGSIAVFILLLACINFINLSTAKSANRAKEVGLRKVVGSVRGYLIRQFLTESLVYSVVSFVFGVLIVTLAIPFFNSLAGTELSIPWRTVWFAPSLAVAALVIGIFAGLYPAFYLSSFKPAEVLKGTVSKGSRSSGLRSALVVFQFATSIVLIIGTFIIYKQMNFILHTKVGFDKDQVVMIRGANTLGEQRTTFKDELLQLSEVEDVTLTDYLPVMGTNRDQNTFWKEGKTREDRGVPGQFWFVDTDYIRTLGMKVFEGRDFDKQLASDSQAVVINQAMVKSLGLKKPVGERITNSYTVFTVIGVVEDFNFESMKGAIGPICLTLGKGGSIAAVKVNSRNMGGALVSLTKVWNKFMPHQPFRYSFLDESYARMYEDVSRTGKILTCFASLAIIVACLGLFALSSFMVEQRGKEISIRLVMGATTGSIFQLLTGNFVKLVLIALVIAAPLSWYLMQRWLEDYTYRINVTWDVFVVAGVISVFIALITVSYQSIRAALANPANRLRSE